MVRLDLPLDKKKRISLKAGERVLLAGRLYTARDMAHQRLGRLIKERKELPIPLRDEVLYYCGPTPPPPGRVVGSCGPTTSSRMDPFTIPLLRKGLGGMIGKGRRTVRIKGYIKKYGAVYFLAAGGAGAFLADRIVSSEVVAFGELGPEAIYRLEVRDFPVVVGIDARGNDIFS